MRKERLMVLAAVIVPLFLFATMALAAEPVKTEAPKPVPEPAYLSLSFGKYGGGETTLKPLLTKERTILVFFQSACIACKTEIIALREGLANNPKANVVGINVDIRPEQLKPFMEEVGFPKTVLLDPKFSLGPNFRVTYTPAVVILDKNGVSLKRIGGFTDTTMGEITSGLN